MFFTLELMKKIIVSLALAGFSLIPLSAEAGQQCGKASYYGLGDGYQGGITASGKKFDTWSNQAAHKWLPFGTVVTVTANGRSTNVIITDRGPFTSGRIIDLSAKSFSDLTKLSSGIQDVCISWT